MYYHIQLLERDETKTIQDLWNPTVTYYANYPLESIRENIADLATLLVKTSRANENGKLMAVRKKYANKKFARISQIAGKHFVIIQFFIIC